jgi:hypothetical protein
MATSAPRWIDLDKLVSQDLRAEMAAFTERVSTYGFTLDDELRAETLETRWDVEIHDDKDGVDDPELFSRIMDWTGYTAFDDARIAAGVHPHSVAIGDIDVP